MSKQKPIAELFRTDLRVVNLGLSSFAETLRSIPVPVIDVDWRPPAGGDADLIRIIDDLKSQDGRSWNSQVAAANAIAIELLLSAEPHIVGIGVAKDVVPGMSERTILHAGPHMASQVTGGPAYKIAFDPCHHHGAVGPMAGVMTASMPVWIVENVTTGNRAYCTLNEGLGKVLRYGA